MPALDTGFDQSSLICRDLHHGNSIKLLRSLTEVSATLEPFVKDNCKSGIGRNTLWWGWVCDGMWMQIMSLCFLTCNFSIDISDGGDSHIAQGLYCTSHVWTYCVSPHPPAWWCWDGQTVPWLMPRRESPSSAYLCILLWESWWLHRSPSCWAVSGDHCTPRQTHLRIKHNEKLFGLFWFLVGMNY